MDIFSITNKVGYNSFVISSSCTGYRKTGREERLQRQLIHRCNIVVLKTWFSSACTLGYYVFKKIQAIDPTCPLYSTTLPFAHWSSSYWCLSHPNSPAPDVQEGQHGGRGAKWGGRGARKRWRRGREGKRRGLERVGQAVWRQRAWPHGGTRVHHFANLVSNPYVQNKTILSTLQ